MAPLLMRQLSMRAENDAEMMKWLHLTTAIRVPGCRPYF